MSAIARNLEEIRGRIADAAVSAGRSPEIIKLIAVCKTFPIDAVAQAVSAGQSCFGENRIQEAEPKIAHFRSLHPLEWHLVGHLQSNKARKACQLFDVVHSVDSSQLAERVARACLELDRQVSVLIQIDLGHEETKFGADENHVREIVETVSKLKGIRLDGLMTLPPYFEKPELGRPYFARLRELLETLESEQPGCLGRRQLSMGMSHDFEIAIQEGATMVRIGTSIFGARPNVRP
jgi:pyridoxal phosphate enzyme (YggS family)